MMAIISSVYSCCGQCYTNSVITSVPYASLLFIISMCTMEHYVMCEGLYVVVVVVTLGNVFSVFSSLAHSLLCYSVFQINLLIDQLS